MAAPALHARAKDVTQPQIRSLWCGCADAERESGFRGPDVGVEVEKVLRVVVSFDSSQPRIFRGPVPEALIRTLTAKRLLFSPELAAHFNEHGHTWSEVVGEAASEVFMAWSYATYIDAVAQSGKSEYALPMYVNAQLPAPQERSGEYPSGGPHPYYMEVWLGAAPNIDFYSPDIYWPEFEYWATILCKPFASAREKLQPHATLTIFAVRPHRKAARHFH